MSAKRNVHVPLRYDKIKTKKVGKKEKSKRKGIKLKKERKKERKKEDSRLSEIEIIQYIFSRLFTIIKLLFWKVILPFIFVFIVYRTVSHIFERLFKPGGNRPNILYHISVYM